VVAVVAQAGQRELAETVAAETVLEAVLDKMERLTQVVVVVLKAALAAPAS
jgi:dihydroneopterin aldolase